MTRERRGRVGENQGQCSLYCLENRPFRYEKHTHTKEVSGDKQRIKDLDCCPMREQKKE